ncbi:putative E3 ubiquitin-protein ligase LIN-1 isoform X2 [Vicia villosa]|uniref:putative E3 ubiquitin-protein ligase LIN-1 isoform X2 n=1 Tax=Vicia villosa TaxID=3911 RepID=UPI00273BA132|nr:putative E3 ubiquitin-protein ligase LIN-1 isoform X2 [Vicia villosa]
MNSVTVTTRAQILRYVTAFITGVIHQSELRRHLLETLHRETPVNQVNLKQLNLAADALESAISSSSSSIRSSSLSLAEKLLLPLHDFPLSSFILSLILILRNRSDESAISLLRIFHLNPSLARSEIAPSLYERLFYIHLFPVYRWFDEQRTLILPSTSETTSRDTGDYSDEFVAMPYAKLLSNVSGEQASKLRELEREYEEVLDENCRVLALYFKEVLMNKDEHTTVTPPLLILKSAAEDSNGGGREQRMEDMQMPVLKNGRYNPMWSERDTSIEFVSSNSSSRSSQAPLYPQRVSPRVLDVNPPKSSKNWIAPVYLNSGPETQFSLDENSLCSSSDSEAENEEKDKNTALLEPQQSQTQEQMLAILKESMGFPDNKMADYENTLLNGSGKQTPPKDFVCPITSNIFDDPVTLETGQTYERKAIEEWFNRENITCPITRQKLQNTKLPKTNYVLKRLVASWKECNPSSVLPTCESPFKDNEEEIKTTMPSASPNSVIAQATADGMISELRCAINNLYMSEILQESEMAVLQIEKLWRGGNMGVDIHSMLSKPPIINGFMEILFNSVEPQVLQAAVFLLAEMGSRDNVVIQTLTRVDTDVECIMALFKKGLTEAVVLLYVLNPPTVTLTEMAIVESLIEVFIKKEEDLVKMCLNPRTAAVLLLAQVIGGSDEIIASSIVKTMFSEKAIEAVVGSLGAEWAEERIAAVEILLRCMQEDGTCRNTIADKAELSPILESFISATDAERFKIVEFFSELIKLNRRTFNERILHIIKEEGPFSTMHTLLIYLQTALQDQRPVMASLLLQLDLLVEPRMMSIYREEAIDTLISCLGNSDFPTTQLAAADTIMSLQGRFNSFGKPLIREVLLKRAGIDKSPRSAVQEDHINNFSEVETIPEEEKAADDWERKIASVLVSHEFGILFEALADGMKSRIPELRSACFISATWLVNMLTILPDTGIQGAARVCLLKQFVNKLNSAKDIEHRILSMLALNSFLHFSDGVRDLTASYAKDILKGLRELKRFSLLASEMLNVLVDENQSKTDIWRHKELIQIDCRDNGEVLSVIWFKDKIISGHTDGRIKVWTLKDNLLLLLQEIQEHTKAVTSLTISESGDRLYSGSLDRSAKIWSIGKEAIHCEQVQDMKDQIHNLVVTNSTTCFIPQGAGVKVHSLNGESKLLNSSKYVKCLAYALGRLYCGCHDSSVQEIHLATGTISNIQSGFKRLLGKSNPIHALKIHGELIYAAGSSLDGTAIKIWNNSNYSMVGSLQTGSEVRAMAVSSELIYLGCKGGVVEIWDKKKHIRVDTLQLGTNCKVNCMTLDSNEEILVIGTSDGQIQAWEMT